MTGTTPAQTQRYVEQSPAVDTNAYASGDLIGSAVIEFEGAVPGDGANSQTIGGLIQSVIITDLAKQSANIDVVFFDANPSNTTFTDNAAFDPADADLPNVIGVVSVTDWKAFNDSSMGQALQVALPFVLDSGNTLYAALVSRGAPTYGASDITVRVGILATP